MKGIEWSVETAGIYLDEIEEDPDIDDYVEEYEDSAARVANVLAADDEVRLKAAEILVGLATKQISEPEAGLLFVAAGVHFDQTLGAFASTDVVAKVVIKILLASLTFYFTYAVQDVLERRRKDKVNEIIREYGFPRFHMGQGTATHSGASCASARQRPTLRFPTPSQR